MNALSLRCVFVLRRVRRRGWIRCVDVPNGRPRQGVHHDLHRPLGSLHRVDPALERIVGLVFGAFRAGGRRALRLRDDGLRVGVYELLLVDDPKLLGVACGAMPRQRIVGQELPHHFVEIVVEERPDQSIMRTGSHGFDGGMHVLF